MGLISTLFGGGARGVAGAVETVAGAFIPNAERADQRAADRYTAAQGAYASEFRGTGWFNRLVDGLNRLPRPMLAFGTIGLFTYCFTDPVAFSERMAALDLVPQELWWLLGAVVSFYFGARELEKSRNARPVKEVVRDIQEIRKLRDHLTPMEAADESADTGLQIAGDAVVNSKNPAILDWFRSAKE